MLVKKVTTRMTRALQTILPKIRLADLNLRNQHGKHGETASNPKNLKYET